MAQDPRMRARTSEANKLLLSLLTLCLSLLSGAGVKEPDMATWKRSWVPPPLHHFLTV